MTYRCKTWAMSRLNTAMEKKLAADQRNNERSMLNITLRDKKRNSWIRQKTKVRDILITLEKQYGNRPAMAMRRRDDRWTTTEWTSRDGRRKRRQRKDGEKKSTATGERPSRVETTFRGLCPAMDSNGCPVNKYYR